MDNKRTNQEKIDLVIELLERGLKALDAEWDKMEDELFKDTNEQQPDEPKDHQTD